MAESLLFALTVFISLCQYSSEQQYGLLVADGPFSAIREYRYITFHTNITRTLLPVASSRYACFLGFTTRLTVKILASNAGKKGHRRIS
jgi:hypothetical protein